MSLNDPEPAELSQSRQNSLFDSLDDIMREIRFNKAQKEGHFPLQKRDSSLVANLSFISDSSQTPIPNSVDATVFEKFKEVRHYEAVQQVFLDDPLANTSKRALFLLIERFHDVFNWNVHMNRNS